MKASDLKASILQLAVSGKLVRQDPHDEPASVLLNRIKKEREALLKAGKIKTGKPLSPVSEKEKPFEIPASWEWVRLGDIGDIIGGGTPETGKKEYWNNGLIPWLTPADMKNVGKYVVKGERNITKLGLQNSSARLLPKFSVIYSSRAPIGYVAITNCELATNQGFKSIIPYNTEFSEYLYYCLDQRTSEIISRASGTTFKEISGGEFSKTCIPLPPLAEQQRIVARIEEFMPLIEAYDREEQKLSALEAEFTEALRQSILQYAVEGKLVLQKADEGTAAELLTNIRKERDALVKEGKIKKGTPLPPVSEEEKPFEIPASWEWVRLGDVTHNFGQKKPETQFTYIDVGSIDNKNGCLGSNLQVILPKDAPSRARKIVKKGTVIYSTVRPYLLNICIIESEPEKEFIASTAFCILAPFSGFLNTYLYYCLRSPVFTEYVSNKMMGMAYPAISDKELLTGLIPLPPLAEQHRIVERIEELMELCDRIPKKVK